ncbi:MAG: sugar ABC transporter permease [Clostridia bacterium]|nr:sugar ABC transporter permease [Clostridia bacterium]
MATIKKKGIDKKLLFYIMLISLPLLQYAIFYIYVNINSFVLAFTSTDALTGVTTFAGFDNFIEVFRRFFASEDSYQFGIMFKNSLTVYGASLVLHLAFSLLFGFYLYKKGLGHGIFKFILFLPNIIPGIALLSIYKYAVETAVIDVYNMLGFEPIYTLLNGKDTVFGTVLFHNLFFGYGTQVMMYLGAMNKINPSISEAAQLDGASYLREFWSIVLPCIYSTVITLVVVGLTGIFASDMGLYSMFAMNAPAETRTLGYYLQRETLFYSTDKSHWPRIAAVGLCFTLVVAPLTIVVKRFLEKRDPMA